MQHAHRDVAHRDCGIMFYVDAALYATLNARAVEEERSLSATIARIVRDALTSEATSNGGSATTRMAVRDGLEG
jgi:hypothetical protein